MFARTHNDINRALNKYLIFCLKGQKRVGPTIVARRYGRYVLFQILKIPVASYVLRIQSHVCQGVNVLEIGRSYNFHELRLREKYVVNGQYDYDQNNDPGYRPDNIRFISLFFNYYCHVKLISNFKLLSLVVCKNRKVKIIQILDLRLILTLLSRRCGLDAERPQIKNPQVCFKFREETLKAFVGPACPHL